MSQSSNYLQILGKGILALILPAISFFSSLRWKFKAPGDLLVITLFSGFVGLNIKINSETNDINRYIQKLSEYNNRDLNHLLDYYVNYFQFKDGYYDIILETLVYLVSIIFVNPMGLVLSFGLIYGVFYSRLIKTLSSYVGNDLFHNILFIVAILYIFPSQAINQFRWWMSVTFFVIGVLGNIKAGKFYTRYDIYMVASFLMHIGILPLLLVYIVYRLFKHSAIGFIMILLAIFTLPNLTEIPLLINLNTESAIGGKLSDYTSEIAEARLENFKGRVWYASFWRDIALVGTSIPWLIAFVRGIFKGRNTLYYVGLFSMYLCAFAYNTIGFYMHFRYFELISYLNLLLLVVCFTDFKWCFGKHTVLVLLPVFIVLPLVVAIKIAGVIHFQDWTFFTGNYILYFVNSLDY